MMDRLDLGTRHLKLFLNIGLGVTEINTTARAVGVIVSEIFNVSLARYFDSPLILQNSVLKEFRERTRACETL